MLALATVWTNPGNMMLGERSQTQKATVCDSIYVRWPVQAHPQRQEVDSWLSGTGGGKWGGGPLMGMGFLLEVMKCSDRRQK